MTEKNWKSENTQFEEACLGDDHRNGPVVGGQKWKMESGENLFICGVFILGGEKHQHVLK